MAVTPALSRLATAAIDMLLPPRCIACGAPVTTAATLCAACWRGLTFLGAPCCACCGLPFEFDLGPGVVCGDCARRQPVFDRARAALRYDDASRKLILGFKHADRLHPAPVFDQWLKRAGEELIADADLAVPVPLHWTRLFRRRFNQAAVLAQALRAAGGPPVVPDAIRRVRRTPSQGKGNRDARRRNVAAAFRLKPGLTLAGKRILLIDDVFTTGATVSECARVLKRGDAARVDVLTLARTVRDAG